MKAFVNLAALTLLIPTAHAGLILEPIAFPGGLNSSWTATVPGMPFFIGTGALRPEPPRQPLSPPRGQQRG